MMTAKIIKDLKNHIFFSKVDDKLVLTVLNAYKPIIEENENLDLISLREEFVLEVIDDFEKEKRI